MGISGLTYRHDWDLEMRKIIMDRGILGGRGVEKVFWKWSLLSTRLIYIISVIRCLGGSTTGNQYVMKPVVAHFTTA